MCFHLRVHFPSFFFLPNIQNFTDCLEVKKVSSWESSPLLCPSLLAGRPTGQGRQSPCLSLLTWGPAHLGTRLPEDQTLIERMNCT